MISIMSILLIFIYVILSVILIWIVTLRIIDKNRIIIYIPFFLFAIFYCYSASNVFYEIIYRGIYEIMVGFKVLIWIFTLIVLRRNLK